jgi:hypothetical protein
MEAFPDGFPEIINIPITDSEVKCTILPMKNKKLSHYDSITSNILKLSVDYISKPLTIIFNKSLATGIYPD